MKTLSAQQSDSTLLGYFRVFAQPLGGKRQEITMFRGAPISVDSFSTQDPFSEQAAQLTLPQVTIFDNPGQGDLNWLKPNTNIDIVWQNSGDHDLFWSWEGFIVSMSFSLAGSESNYQVDLKGAFYGLDDYLAIPSFPKRPIPYEILIAMAFDQKAHPASLGPIRIDFPDGWNTVVPSFKDPEYLAFLKPWGVATNQKWTGFTSRSTGSWEPLLSGHVQSLLTVMFAEGGSQWSIRNRGARRPELYLREIPHQDYEEIIEVTLGAPGVSIQGAKDYTQRASVIYGQGVDEAGISYSGMQVSPDGLSTFYKPFAYSPAVWPRASNPLLRGYEKPKEVLIRFQDGVDEISARKIALGQYHRFADPGVTGTLTLGADARYADGRLCPRVLIRAGVTIRINGFQGLRDGLLVHITESSVDAKTGTVNLSFDSKYRDQLTVEEVKARTRDALTPMRALQVGKYANTVQDLVLPWSYKEGSGAVPTKAKDFFQEKIPSTATFPFEEYTKKYPPSNPAYRPYYIRIGPTNKTDSEKNWSGVARNGDTIMSIPIRMAQAGSIRLTQLAAYDKNGNVMKVRFHFSVYSNNGIAADAMPNFPTDPSTGEPKYLSPAGVAENYGVHQANPFFKGAWETVNPDGTAYENDSMLVAKDAGLIVGWGNYYEPAGYSPGRFSRGAARTGILEDNATWSWDLSDILDLQSPANNANEEYSGMLFVQIFCDEQGDEPVFFMGRLIRQEPGTG